MKLCMSQYSYESMPDGEQVIKFHWIFTLENGFNFEKLSFMSRFVLFDPKLNPHVNFSNFEAEESFLIFKIFGMSQ